VCHQRIGVALDDHRLAALAHRRLRSIDQVERPALVEQRRRRGVQVLRTVALQNPAAEADGIAVRVPDREDHPLAEPVVDAAAR